MEIGVSDHRAKISTSISIQWHRIMLELNSRGLLSVILISVKPTYVKLVLSSVKPAYDKPNNSRIYIFRLPDPFDSNFYIFIESFSISSLAESERNMFIAYVDT